MDFDAHAYPDTFDIGGASLKGRRDRAKSEVYIPYSEEPNVAIGQTISQRSGSNVIELKVLDADFLPDGSQMVGTKHPNLLTLHVENLTAAGQRTPPPASAINIGTLNGQNVQVGNQNHQAITISLAQMVERVAASNDAEAKGKLRSLLENSTVSAIVGAGVTALIGALGG
jgi:hypothetical protein